MAAVPNSLRVILLVLGGFVVVAVAAPAMRLPPPLGQILTLLIAAAGMYVWYRLDRQYEVRRGRLENGLCLECGDDLRGNISGVCPKCGTGVRWHRYKAGNERHAPPSHYLAKPLDALRAKWESPR